MFFKTSQNPFDSFDFNYIDNLFVENRLMQWFGKENKDGKEMTSFADFFQPNYLTIQKKAFFWGLDTIPDELNFSWIANLHHLATSTLKHELGSAIRKDVRRIQTELAFHNPLVQAVLGLPSKASPDGIESLFTEISHLNLGETENNVSFFLADVNIDPELTPDGQVIDVSVAKQYYLEQQNMFSEHENLLKKILSDAQVSPEIYFSSGINIIDEEQKNKILLVMGEVAKNGLGPLLKRIGYNLSDRNPFLIRAKAEDIINNYNRSSKNTENEKLDAIIILVKGLLNLHVWPDGNGRLCAHQLLNLLLIKNGFRPALLDNNCLDAFTIDELRERIIKGMKAFREKCTQEGNTLAKFREENGLPSTQKSDFSKAILQNQIEDAKKCLSGTTVAITSEELDLFTNYRDADINWFNLQENPQLFVDNSPCNKDELVKALLELGIRNANENLLLSVINYCLEENPELLNGNVNFLREALVYGTFKIFELLKPTLISHLQREFLRLIPYCQNEKIANELINFVNTDDLLPEYYTGMLKKLVSLQTYSIIEKFIALDRVKYYLLLDNTSLANDLIDVIKNRIDLTLDEKNNIIKLVNAKRVREPSDPLNDFPSRATTLNFNK